VTVSQEIGAVGRGTLNLNALAEFGQTIANRRSSWTRKEDSAKDQNQKRCEEAAVPISAP